LTNFNVVAAAAVTIADIGGTTKNGVTDRARFR
jgi:hypothetical protein